jgi:hypothetical protein
MEQNYCGYLACLINYREQGAELLGIFGMFHQLEGTWSRIIVDIWHVRSIRGNMEQNYREYLACQINKREQSRIIFIFGMSHKLEKNME